MLIKYYTQKIKRLFGVVSPSEHQRSKQNSGQNRGNAPMDLRLKNGKTGREWVKSL